MDEDVDERCRWMNASTFAVASAASACTSILAKGLGRWKAIRIPGVKYTWARMGAFGVLTWVRCWRQRGRTARKRKIVNAQNGGC